MWKATFVQARTQYSFDSPFLDSGAEKVGFSQLDTQAAFHMCFQDINFFYWIGPLQYLDNDNNGVADDPKVICSMVKRNAAMVLYKVNYFAEKIRAKSFVSQFKDEADGARDLLPEGYHYQTMYGRDAQPDGIPHNSTSTAYKNGKFDATLEEVLHLINAAGHAYAYRSRLVVIFISCSLTSVQTR